MATTEYNGRKIGIRRTKRNDFPALEVKINGNVVWTYYLHDVKTEEALREQIQREIDFCDSRTEGGFEWFWYREVDPRRDARRKVLGLDDAA